MKIPETIDPKRYKVKKGLAGLGLFAMDDIKKGEWIIEYVGELKSNKEIEDNTTKYLFEVNSKWTIDGSMRSNTARYINHAHHANAEPEVIKNRVFIQAKKPIKKGDEITYDYGKEYYDEFIKPYGCKCAYCQTKGKVAKK